MTSIELIDALLKLGVVLVFALVAIASKAIDKGGFLASVLVGYSILLGGGWSWFIVVATFFTLGVGFTYYKYEYKKRIGGAQEKGGSRNWPNIIANGGVASIFALLELLSQMTGWSAPPFGGSSNAIMFVGAMSAAAADTIATEVGLLSRSSPILITNPSRKVSPGTSGGVTATGFLGAYNASMIIGILALVLGVVNIGPKLIVIAVFGGVVGSVADSVFGATIQRKGLCAVCGKACEKSLHCGEKVSMTGGIKFVENNVVNLFATTVGAVASLLLALVL